MLAKNPLLDQDDETSTKTPETLPQMQCFQNTGITDFSCPKFSDESFTEEADNNDAQFNASKFFPTKICEHPTEPRKSFSRVRHLLSHSLV